MYFFNFSILKNPLTDSGAWCMVGVEPSQCWPAEWFRGVTQAIKNILIAILALYQSWTIHLSTAMLVTYITLKPFHYLYFQFRKWVSAFPVEHNTHECVVMMSWCHERLRQHIVMCHKWQQNKTLHTLLSSTISNFHQGEAWRFLERFVRRWVCSYFVGKQYPPIYRS